MSESDEEVLEVSEEFKHLFKDARVKFEGLPGEIEEEYVELVKGMGAEVSNDARIIFMQGSYFEKFKNKITKDKLLCNINYIADCVKAGKRVAIRDYIFIPDIPDNSDLDDEPLCYSARYIYKTDSCQECYYKEVFCKECAKESIKESLKAANQKENHIISASQSSSKDEIVNRPGQAIKKSNTSSKRLISSDSEQDSSDKEQMKTSCTKKSSLRKKLKNSSNIDDTCKGEEPPKIKIENHSESDHSQSDDNSVNNSPKEQVEEASNGIPGTAHRSIKPGVLKWKRKNGVAETKQDDNLSDDSSDNETNAKTNKHKKSPQKSKGASNSGWITSSKPKLPVKTEPLALPQPEPLFNDVDENHYFNGNKWWLPQDVPDEKKCTIPSCSFEPTDHPSHYPPVKFLSLVEKKILVKYLITKNAIGNAKGKLVYVNMISDGYLTHRTWESLRTCFRQTIIKSIETYGLDQNILNQFLGMKTVKSTKAKKEI